MTVRLYKLVSGEEIVASVVDESTNQDYVTVKTACSLQVVPKGPQQYALALLPYMRGEPDGEIKLFKLAIASEVDANADLERSYLSQTSGIEIASSLSPLLG